MMGVAGKDATKKFDKYHRRALLDTYRPKLRIGKLGDVRAVEKPKKSFWNRIGIKKS